MSRNIVRSNFPVCLVSSRNIVSSASISCLLTETRILFIKTKVQQKKANLRDFIAATGIVILLKLDSDHWFFILYDLEIRWVTSKNNRGPLLSYIKPCALFQSYQWIQTGVTIRKCSIQVKIYDFLSSVTLKFDGWPLKAIRHLFYATSSFVHHFIAISQFKLQLQSGNAKFR